MIQKNSRFLIAFLFFFTLSLVRADDARTMDRDADLAFERSEFSKALELYELARNNISGTKNNSAAAERWKSLTLGIIRCSQALNDTDRAVLEFFLLCENDPLVGLEDAPIPWYVPPSRPGSAQLREKQAADWLDPLKAKKRGPSATLMAAATLSVSMNSNTSVRGYQSLQMLAQSVPADELKTASKDRLTELKRQAALLATAMLWKQRIPTLRNESELLQMKKILEMIPDPLQKGPHFLLGLAHKQLGNNEEAILSWMRVVVLFPNEKSLADAAAEESAKMLEKLGRKDQASTIRRLKGK